jgi:hypothetical protein
MGVYGSLGLKVNLVGTSRVGQFRRFRFGSTKYHFISLHIQQENV